MPCATLGDNRTMFYKSTLFLKFSRTKIVLTFNQIHKLQFLKPEYVVLFFTFCESEYISELMTVLNVNVTFLNEQTQ